MSCRSWRLRLRFAAALGENEYFEYSVGDGEWVQFKKTVESIPFGGTLGSLRLRGKSRMGTASSINKYSKIEFTTEKSPVDCTGDIRTLIDYENYADVNTANAMFCKLFNGNKQLRTAPSLPATTLADYCYIDMFYGCSALTQAPELKVTTLADCCYGEMFSGCSNLSSATMLATNIEADMCLTDWLTNAGTNVEWPGPTLTLDNEDVRNEMCNMPAEFNYLPDNWKYNVQYKNNQ